MRNVVVSQRGAALRIFHILEDWDEKLFRKLFSSSSRSYKFKISILGLSLSLSFGPTPCSLWPNGGSSSAISFGLACSSSIFIFSSTRLDERTFFFSMGFFAFVRGVLLLSAGAAVVFRHCRMASASHFEIQISLPEY